MNITRVLSYEFLGMNISYNKKVGVYIIMKKYVQYIFD